jgi:hypothetical protein
MDLTGESGFDSKKGREISARDKKAFCLLLSGPTGAEAHPASYPMGSRALSYGIRQPGREVLRNLEVYLYFPIRLCGVVLS